MPKALEVVIFLKLCDVLQSLSFDELTNSPAVGDFEKICLEVIVGETKVKELLRVFLHLLQLGLNCFLEIFADVWAEVHHHIWYHFNVVLDLIVLSLFEKANTNRFSLFRHYLI